jgi:hypothetical protein
VRVLEAAAKIGKVEARHYTFPVEARAIESLNSSAAAAPPHRIVYAFPSRTVDLKRIYTSRISDNIMPRSVLFPNPLSQLAVHVALSSSCLCGPNTAYLNRNPSS